MTLNKSCSLLNPERGSRLGVTGGGVPDQGWLLLGEVGDMALRLLGTGGRLSCCRGGGVGGEGSFGGGGGGGSGCGITSSKNTA